MVLGQRDHGVIVAGSATFACRIGRGGRRRRKREGDGATPGGVLPVRGLAWRADRSLRPACRLPAVALRVHDGWCDDPASQRYNRPVPAGSPGSHERMWRRDRLYDVVVVLGHNDRPARKGLGSAIFLHLTGPDGGPTKGCVALAPRDLSRLLTRLSAETPLVVG